MRPTDGEEDAVLHQASVIPTALPSSLASAVINTAAGLLSGPVALPSISGPLTYADKESLLLEDVAIPSSILSNREAHLSQDALYDSENEYASRSGDSPTSTLTSASAPTVRDTEKISRPKRKRISPMQLETLVNLFAETDTPTYEVREAVGQQLGMSNREVQVWFQNRRAKERNSRQRQQYQALRDSQLHGHQDGNTGQAVLLAAALASESSSQVAFPSTDSAAWSPSASQSHSESGDIVESTRQRSVSPSNVRHLGEVSTQSSFTPSYDVTRPIESAVQAATGPMRPRNIRQGSSQSHPFARPIPATGDPRPVFRHARNPSAGAVLSAVRNEAPLLPHRTLSYQDARHRAETYPAGTLLSASGEALSQETVSLDRRSSMQSSRLPPIRLLLDMADQAVRSGVSSHNRPISATATSPLSPWSAVSPGSHSIPLTSPFGHLTMQDARAVVTASAQESDSAGKQASRMHTEPPSYFDQR